MKKYIIIWTLCAKFFKNKSFYLDLLHRLVTLILPVCRLVCFSFHTAKYAVNSITESRIISAIGFLKSPAVVFILMFICSFICNDFWQRHIENIISMECWQQTVDFYAKFIGGYCQQSFGGNPSPSCGCFWVVSSASL